jgi:hypothetical protein
MDESFIEELDKSIMVIIDNIMIYLKNRRRS